MSGWFVFAAWALGAVLSWRPFVMSFLDSFERNYPGHPLDGGDRAEAAWMGVMCAAAWPATLPVRWAWRALMHRQVLLTPNEKAAAEKRELEALRKLAREHGLPMPESKS